MSAEAIATLIKMMESLPESAQAKVVEHLRDYIEDLRDELQWDLLFDKTRTRLAAAAQRAKREIAAGHAKPMDYDHTINGMKGVNRVVYDLSSKPPSAIEWE